MGTTSPYSWTYPDNPNVIDPTAIANLVAQIDTQMALVAAEEVVQEKMPSASIVATSTTAVALNTTVTLTYTTAWYDPNSMFSTTGIVAPAGLWRVSGRIHASYSASNTSTTAKLNLIVGGVVRVHNKKNATPDDILNMAISGLVYLPAPATIGLSFIYTGAGSPASVGAQLDATKLQ
jgi:hypothetical protein